MKITKEIIERARELYVEIKDQDWEGDLTPQDKWGECVRMVMEEKKKEIKEEIKEEKKKEIKEEIKEEVVFSNLKGTEKQKIWAEKIRKEQVENLPAELARVLAGVEDAKQIIEDKDEPWWRVKRIAPEIWAGYLEKGDYSMPELQGSEKQVAWANEIRVRVLAEYPFFAAEISTITSAKTFIDRMRKPVDARDYFWSNDKEKLFAGETLHNPTLTRGIENLSRSENPEVKKMVEWWGALDINDLETQKRLAKDGLLYNYLEDQKLRQEIFSEAWSEVKKCLSAATSQPVAEERQQAIQEEGEILEYQEDYLDHQI